jgi:TRAP-type C4-dicarboxylate transport system permease small subunit
MRKLINAFHKAAGYGAAISMLAMLAAITIQVVARFLLPSAPNWTEEAARMCFVWLVAFGVGIGIRDQAFVKLEILSNYLGREAQRRLQIFIFTIIFLFSVSMLYYSFLFVQIGMSEQSPALGLNMSLVFASIVVMMISIALLSLEQVLDLLYMKSKKA